MDDDRDFRNAAERAELYLQSMAKTKGTSGHSFDMPGPVIRDMIVDLMHYAEARNQGKKPDDIFYIDMNKEFELAKKQFIAEKERQTLAVDPKLEQLLVALDKRQAEERTALTLRQADEAKKLGDTPQLHERHRKQFEQQDKKFGEECDRYVRDYQESRRLANDLTLRDKTQNLSLDGPKRTK